MKEIVLNIDSSGRIQFVYDDELKPVVGAGDAVIRRASHVEPTAVGEWSADLSPIGGPVLGPFPTREMAIQAEVRLLNCELSLGGVIEFG